MILAFSAAIICPILFAVEISHQKPASAPLLAGALAGLAIAGACLWKMLKLNRQWTDDFRLIFEGSPDELLAQWEVDEALWKTFAENEMEDTEKNIPSISLWFGGLIAFVLLLAGWKAPGFPTVLYWSIGIGTIAAGLCYVIERIAARRKWNMRNREQSASIWLRTDGIRINNRTFQWQNFGANLEDVHWEDAEPDRPWAIFQVDYRINAGSSRVSHTVRVPVPPHHVSQVRDAAESLRK